jgi:drug/metabolite transporter (DMT)-like permease
MQVSIVQPVSSVGLAFLAAFSHFYLQEKLQWYEWVAAGTAGLGIVCLGISSSGSGGGGASPPVDGLSEAAIVAAAEAAKAAAAAAAPPLTTLPPPPQPPPVPMHLAAAQGPSAQYIAVTFLLCIAAVGARACTCCGGSGAWWPAEWAY